MKNELLLWVFVLCTIATQAQDLSKLSYEELNSMIRTEYAEGDFEKAVHYTQTAKSKAEAEFGKQDTVVAKYCLNLGVFYRQLGQYDKAEQFLLESKKIREKTIGTDHPDFSKSLNNLANLYSSMGQYEKAEPLFLQAKDIRAKTVGEQHPDFAKSLNNLAILYESLGQYEKAEPLLLQAKSILVQALGEEHPAVAPIINNLGTLYYNLQLYEKAIPFYLQTSQIQAKTLGEQHPDYAVGLGNMAGVYKEMKKYDKAEALFLKTMELQAKGLGKQHPNYANTITNLAMLYQATQQWEKAEPLFLQANAIWRAALGNKNPDVSHTEYKISLFYLDMQRLDTALYYAQQSIVSNCLQMDSSFNDWANLDKMEYISNVQLNSSLQGLISIFKAQYSKTGDKNKLQQAYAISQAAINLNERIRNEFSEEVDKLAALTKNSDFVLDAIYSGIELKQPQYEAEAFRFAELNKGVLLMNSAKAERAYLFGNLPDSLAKEEQALQAQHSQLKAKLAEKRSQTEKDSLQALLNNVNGEIDAFRKMLKGEYPKYVALKYENKSTSAADIQALLDDKTAIIEYVLSYDGFYVFYIDKKTVNVLEVLMPKDSLNQKIESFHSLLSNYKEISNSPQKAYQDYTNIAYWTYQNLLEKSLKNAVGIEHLVIIPDGELAHLPFEALLREKANGDGIYSNLHYLINDFKISYNYSAALWKENLESIKNKNNGQIFGIAANYQNKLDSAKKETRLPVYRNLRDVLLPLPAARKEVEMLSDNFMGYYAFDSLATESNFKQKASEYGIIHLAMHGVLDKKSPILSSLAFTENGDSLENNFLQAYEISQMQLHADLVVLSACETGYGKFETGNGTASLARAFMYAGVPALVVSLWEVNDASTSQIMNLFYTNMAAGMDKAEALRQAKIRYIKEAQGVGAHPAFWSPFVQIGDSRAIEVKPQSRRWLWWVIGGVGVLGLSFFMLSRMKSKR